MEEWGELEGVWKGEGVCMSAEICTEEGLEGVIWCEGEVEDKSTLGKIKRDGVKWRAAQF